MKNNFKVTIPLAIIITLAFVIYQRATGPTYPKRFKIQVGEEKVTVKLLRSHGGDTDALIKIPKLSEDMAGTITYRRFPTNDLWIEHSLKEENEMLVASLPHQPPAGKLQYFVHLTVGGQEQKLGSQEDPIFIRFKGDVPSWILGPHIFFMFFSILLSMLALLEVLFKTKSYYKIGLATTFCLLFGGMFLGPIVQKYAFGVYWAGFPIGYDLTDNKLLIGVVFWVLACLINWRKKAPWAIVVASIVLLMVYAIPHSMMGSQYNYESQQVETAR